ncbi:MAG TPA: ABC transporter ATP-binding protein [Gammaproteobacteria bacterium]|nr:ABC transporter ATP-binding protein [Gammaproteobacteria bacterium]
MIEVEGLTRRYGSTVAASAVSFTASAGQIVGLLGHNGAGKTTIMKMLAGYLEPTAGSIRIDGRVMGEATRQIQARLGYLPENCPLWPEMTVIDYLDYQASLHGLAPASRPAAIARAIRRTALGEKAAAPIHTLSRGYRQRVGVAQALLHEPQLIILDEPTNGLDPTQIRQMRGLIRELAGQATVILSTHILQEVQAVCDRVLILRAGRLVVDAELAELQRGRGLEVVTGAEAAATLAAVPGVSEVQAQERVDGRWRYRLAAPATAAPAVAAALAGAGIALHALTPRRRDLEALFTEINEQEPADA